MAPVFRFGAFEADYRTGDLRKGGAKVRLQEQPFQLLRILLESPGAVVAREALRQRLWPESPSGAETGAALNNAVSRLRDALGDSAESPRFLETVARRGYRFLAPVERIGGDGAAGPAPGVSAPVGPPPRRRRWATAAVVASVGLAAVFAWRSPAGRPAASPPPSRLMLVVLPFQNLSGDPQDEYFSDGLTDEMISALGRLHPLRLGVIARTTSMSYKHSLKPVAQIGRELGVDYLLEGTVRRTGDHVRIATSLVRVGDQSRVWAQEFDRELRDVLDVQAEVASTMAENIQVELSAEQRARLQAARRVDPEAHLLYLRGRFFWNKRTRQGIEEAVELFGQSLARDPRNASALAGLADCHVFRAWNGFAQPADAFPPARDAAQRALALDEGLAEAHAALGLVSLLFDWNTAVAERDFRRAIELNPSYSFAHVWYAFRFVVAGRGSEAVAEGQRGLALDPLSLGANAGLAHIYLLAGEYDRAIRQAEETIALDASYFVPYHTRGRALEASGRYQQALRSFEEGERLSPGNPHNRARCLALAGRTAEARALLAEMERAVPPLAPEDLARVTVALGDADRTIELLERAYRSRAIPLLYVGVTRDFDPLRSDPRFQDLLKRIGIGAHESAAGAASPGR